jgi:EAL domain-containing protein (putative c-di-GMP-specific phosphodiesterase class I)/GGDEF domain-containing protein
MVLWPIEGLVLRWPTSGVAWLVGTCLVAILVWCALRVAKELSPAWCHVLALLASGLVAILVYSGRGTGPVVAGCLFVVPVATFVALFLGSRAVVAHVVLTGVLIFIALAGSLHAGGAALVGLVVILAALSGAFTVRILIASLWRTGSVDPDTGLPNGVGLAQQLSSARAGALSGAKGPFVMATVLLAGLDDARQALGYQVGTELLRRAVEDLGQVLPAGAFITRVEADELVVTYEVPGDLDTGSDGAEAAVMPAAMLALGKGFAVELARTIGSGRYLVDKVEVLLRAHVGLVFAPFDGSEVAELVRRSSLSARRAASSGQTLEVWDGDRDALTAEDLALLADLRLAIEHKELWLAYQPQVATGTSRTVSVEALLRWSSPVHGNVAPGRFIVLAEQTGLIDRLTEWVMSEALDAQLRWRKAGLDIPVSVNLSAKTLSRPELAKWVISELETRGLAPEVLTVEVTETAAADLAQADRVLRPLHRHGVRVSIDDFGTGYTSLAAIPYLPLDEIKVDLSFVKRAVSSPADEAIVRCVRELSHKLGLVTVAEGVEDEEVEALMTAIGFDLLQGYHLSRPLAEEALMDFLQVPRRVRVPAVGREVPPHRGAVVPA